MSDTLITSDDKIWAAVAYLFLPLAPLCIFLMPEKRTRPFIRYHSIHALCTAFLLFFLGTPLLFFTFGLGIVVWLCIPYLAYTAYRGNYTKIPLLTNVIKEQMGLIYPSY
ncbi:MAG: hypothetical protein HPY45_03235 [Anaerolineae bacterium]|nr:hypothetical protein [Anaerolineae bacterium]